LTVTIPELAGSFYAGVDLAKEEDFTAVAVLRKDEDAFRLIHLNVFPQRTEYVGVINYLKALSERLKTIHRILVDQTGAGEAAVEEVKRTVPNIEGIVLTAPRKQRILGYLKLMMQEKRVLFPYELDFLQELNAERFELTKSGQIQFSHPDGTHDDRFWAFALAVFATKTTPTLKIRCSVSVKKKAKPRRKT
jgi:phage FluMu gp28-like protein